MWWICLDDETKHSILDSSFAFKTKSLKAGAAEKKFKKSETLIQKRAELTIVAE